MAAHLTWPLPNVWLGCSVENQQTADERIPHLLRVPAAVRFLSCEPLLGAVDIQAAINRMPWQIGGGDAGLHWVIAGGESGGGARPCDIAWIRSLVAQCKAAEVPVFVKQLGAKINVPNDSSLEWPREGDEWIYPADALVSYQGELITISLTDRKGGDMAEWPEDLRVREMPAAQQYHGEAR